MLIYVSFFLVQGRIFKYIKVAKNVNNHDFIVQETTNVEHF